MITPLRGKISMVNVIIALAYKLEREFTGQRARGAPNDNPAWSWVVELKLRVQEAKVARVLREMGEEIAAEREQTGICRWFLPVIHPTPSLQLSTNYSMLACCKLSVAGESSNQMEWAKQFLELLQSQCLHWLEWKLLNSQALGRIFRRVYPQ